MANLPNYRLRARDNQEMIAFRRFPNRPDRRGVDAEFLAGLMMEARRRRLQEPRFERITVKDGILRFQFRTLSYTLTGWFLNGCYCIDSFV